MTNFCYSPSSYADHFAVSGNNPKKFDLQAKVKYG